MNDLEQTANSVKEKVHKSSAHVQTQAEEVIFHKVEKLLNIKLEKNKKIYLADNAFTYMQPDLYSEENLVVGEIFAHIGKPKKAQDNKIANDILKMLLLEKTTGNQYRKIIVVCDLSEKKKLEGKSILAESIRRAEQMRARSSLALTISSTSPSEAAATGEESDFLQSAISSSRLLSGLIMFVQANATEASAESAPISESSSA